MKVMCIAGDGLWQDCITHEDSGGPAFKEISTVSGTMVCGCCGVLSYKLVEYSGEDYHADCFIPLDELRETLQEQEVIVKVVEAIKPILAPVKIF